MFTEISIIYFFLGEGNSFEQDVAQTWLTDMANDGEIGAIVDDPTSEGNDVIIIHSK